MATILDGKKLSEEIALKLKAQIEKLDTKPKLVIIQVGDLAESNSYIKRKISFASDIGAIVEHKKYPEDVTEENLITDIQKLNANKTIHGIIVQLPIPSHLETAKILRSVDAKKDIDGFSGTFSYPTAQGIITLLSKYRIAIAGKKVTVVGTSDLVGKPIAMTLLENGATVTMCNKQTKDLPEETRRSEILVVAAGHPILIGHKHVSIGQTVIDVGITVVDKKVIGDVDFENVEKIVGAITPVPGGVGPMTIASLFQNLLQAYKLQT